MAPTPEQLDTMVRQMYGADAWMLDIPEVRTVLEQAAANLWDQATLESKIRQTDWWRTTSQAQQQYQQLRATSPAELDASIPGSRANQMASKINQMVGKAGFFPREGVVGGLVDRAIQFNWNDAQIQAAMAAEMGYDPNAPAGSPFNNAGAAAQQLQTLASDYYVNLDPSVINTWMQGIAAGNQTPQMFQDYLKNQAMGKYQGAAKLLGQGLTMRQITDSYRQDAARIMEVSPAQIDFQNDPTYQKVLQYVDPNDKQQRMMTNSEMGTYLRGTTQWGNTQQARDQVGQQVKSLLTTFGAIA